MNLLLICSIIDNDWAHINALIIVITVLYACVFLSVLIDLFFGIRRAIRQKIARTSIGYRHTITKLTSYFGLLLMLSIADVAASVILNLPYFTVFDAIGIVFVGAKSVFENIRQDEKNVVKAQQITLKYFGEQRKNTIAH